MSSIEPYDGCGELDCGDEISRRFVIAGRDGSKLLEFAEEVPYACFKTDQYLHAQEIWTRGVAGDFGEIAPYIEYVTPTNPAPEPQPEVSGAQTL